MRRLARILSWKLRVGGNVDSGLKVGLERFFEEMLPVLVIGLMVLVVMVHGLMK